MGSRALAAGERGESRNTAVEKEKYTHSELYSDSDSDI